MREEGDLKKSLDQPPINVIPPINVAAVPSSQPVQQAAPLGYSRYDQERFSHNRDEEGFKIDTMETFHGLTLKSVTEGVSTKKSQTPLTQNNNNNVNNNNNTNNRSSVNNISNNVANPTATPKSIASAKLPATQKKSGFDNNNNNITSINNKNKIIL